MIMAKRKQKSNKNTDRNKVNFKNKKTMILIANLQLAENTLSKNDVLQIANKDIYYKLKNSGYIKESNGRVKATPKLQNYIKKLDNSSFSYSCSRDHAKRIRNSLSLLPESVLVNRAFTSGVDVEKKYKRFSKTQTHKTRLEQMKQGYKSRLSSLNKEHVIFSKTKHNEQERYTHNLNYQRQREKIISSLNRLEREICLTPDYQVTFTRTELDSYIDNLEHYREELNENSRQYSLYTQSIEQLRGLEFQDTISISIELVTTHYHTKELELHKNHSILTNTPQIFLM